MDLGVVITETLGRRVLTLTIGSAGATGWTPAGNRAWLGRDADGALVAVTAHGHTPAEARAALIEALLQHDADAASALGRILR